MNMFNLRNSHSILRVIILVLTFRFLKAKLIKSSTAPHRLQSPPKQIPIKIIKDVLITSKLSKNQSDDFDTSRDPGSQLEFLLSHRYYLSIVLYLSYVHRY